MQPVQHVGICNGYGLLRTWNLVVANSEKGVSQHGCVEYEFFSLAWGVGIKQEFSRRSIFSPQGIFGNA